MKFSVVKGVFDILPFAYQSLYPWQSVEYWNYVEEIARIVCRLNGFVEIRTPIFEYSELFYSLGQDSDIVSKEMYTFLDKKGRSLTLRPEGTAAVIRAFIQYGLYERTRNYKLFYILPMFRYERQQTGRYRQHHQFGVESIGEKNFYKDAEILLLLNEFYEKLQLKSVRFELNCLGCGETRKRYVSSLEVFLKKHSNELSELSRERMHRNPLRILDSKEKEDLNIIQEAPSILSFLTEDSLKYFENILKVLRNNKIDFIKNDRLVRGLDYYTDLVFEATVKPLHDKDAPTLALGGGGRYDDLICRLGGPNLAACGFGTGVERIIQAIIQQKKEPAVPPSVFLRFLPMGSEAQEKSFSLKQSLKDVSFAVEVDWSGKNLKAMLKDASKDEIPFVCIIGEDELKTGQLTLKNMKEHITINCSEKELKKRLITYYEI